MAPDRNAKLQQIRDKIINDLGGMSDQLAGSDGVSIEALIAIARSTNKPELLDKAVEKAEAIEDASERADALLDLLDEIEAQISEPTSENQETSLEDSSQSTIPVTTPGPDQPSNSNLS